MIKTQLITIVLDRTLQHFWFQKSARIDNAEVSVHMEVSAHMGYNLIVHFYSTMKTETITILSEKSLLYDTISNINVLWKLTDSKLDLLQVTEH